MIFPTPQNDRLKDATIKRNDLFFRQLLFLSILVLIAVTIILKLSFFIGSFLGAITLYVVFRQPMHTLVNKYRWRRWTAALLFVTASTLILGVLAFGVFRLVAKELQGLDFHGISMTIRGWIAKIEGFLPPDIIPANFLSSSSTFLSSLATGVINNTYSFVANILMMILILYFMLVGGHRMEKRLDRYNPFEGESREMVNNELTGIIYSNAVGIPLTMLSQGLAAAMIYWLFGMDNVVFWAFITALCGLIPMIGTIIVSVPLGVMFILDGFVLKGILLMACGLLIIANIDNLTRIVLNKKITNTHPLVVIFGVFLGIPLFGFWGIIFGPLLISLFLLLIKIYYHEFKLMTPQQEREETLDNLGQEPPEKIELM